jgi:hypothetical protein
VAGADARAVGAVDADARVVAVVVVVVVVVVVDAAEDPAEVDAVDVHVECSYPRQTNWRVRGINDFAN